MATLVVAQRVRPVRHGESAAAPVAVARRATRRPDPYERHHEHKARHEQAGPLEDGVMPVGAGGETVRGRDNEEDETREVHGVPGAARHLLHRERSDLDREEQVHRDDAERNSRGLVARDERHEEVGRPEPTKWSRPRPTRWTPTNATDSAAKESVHVERPIGRRPADQPGRELQTADDRKRCERPRDDAAGPRRVPPGL